MFPFTHHTDAKDSRPVQATAVPAGTKATKLQPAKTADKGKKQAAVKKAGVNTTAESAEDKNKQTKPQVTHELSVVCFLMLKKYCFYIYHIARGLSRIFFRRGCTRLLLDFNTNKPHSFFFFCRIPVVLENCRSSQGGCAPPAPSP